MNNHSYKIIFLFFLLIGLKPLQAESPPTIAGKASDLIANYKFARAEELILKGMKEHGNSLYLQKFYIRRYVIESQGNCPLAVKLYKKLLKAHEKDDEIMSGIAGCEEKSGRILKSKRWLLRAITAAKLHSSKPESSKTRRAKIRLNLHYSDLINLYRFTGSPEQTKKTIAEALKSVVNHKRNHLFRSIAYYYLHRAMVSLSDGDHSGTSLYLKKYRKVRLRYEAPKSIHASDSVHFFEKVNLLHRKYQNVKPDIEQKILVVALMNNKSGYPLAHSLKPRQMRRVLAELKGSEQRIIKNYYNFYKNKGLYILRPALSRSQRKYISRALLKTKVATRVSIKRIVIHDHQEKHSRLLMKVFARAVEAYSKGRIKISLQFTTMNEPVVKRVKAGTGYIPSWKDITGFKNKISPRLKENDIAWFQVNQLIGFPRGIAAILDYPSPISEEQPIRRGMIAVQISRNPDPVSTIRIHLHEYFHICEMRFGIRPIHGGYIRPPNKIFPGFTSQNGRWQEFDYYLWQLSKNIPAKHKSFQPLNLREGNLPPKIISK